MSSLRKAGAVVAAVALAGTLSACHSHYDYGPKTQWGAAIGAAGGGLAAAATGTGGAGIAAGVLLGGLLGGAIGNSLDARDRELAEYHAYEGLEYGRSGERVYWENPDSGNYGYFTPEPAYRTSYGTYCREYQQTIYVGGRAESGYGTACRQPDGTWEIM